MDKKSYYEEEAKKLSIDELKEIQFNRDWHNGWLITAARKELELRKIKLTKEELDRIETKKKKTIEDAKRNSSVLLEDPFFNYTNLNISSINMSFDNVGYNKRIRNEMAIAFLVCVSIGIISVLIKYQRLGVLETIGIIGFSILFTLIGLYSSLVRNRFYLINLNADKQKIEIEYLDYNTTNYFQSSIHDIEIIRKRTFSKHPTPILIIKRDGKTVLKLYTQVNYELLESRMELLIKNLKRLKEANS